MTRTKPRSKDDFRKIRKKNDYYVDKSLFIKDFLDNGEELTLITRPRRFGKTLNLTMLREFFDLTKDSKEIFQGLNVMETASANLINRKPVIYLTLKNCLGKNILDIKKGIKAAVFSEYAKYYRIFKLAQVDSEDPYYIYFYHTYKMLASDSEVDDFLLSGSLLWLSKALETFYEESVILLIDEYDAPLMNAHEIGDQAGLTRFMAGFLGSAVKGNDHLDQALLTGIQRVAKESIFSQFNNVAVYTVLDDTYSQYFGFTEDEVLKIMEDFQIKLPVSDIKRYYDGYRFGNQQMYNPFSLMDFAAQKELGLYWVNTSTNQLIRDCLLNASTFFHSNFKKLIEKGSVKVNVNLQTAFMELETEETLWGLFVNAGYLTVAEKIDPSLMKVTLPNLEVESEIKKLVQGATSLTNERTRAMLLSLIEGRIESFISIYREIILENLSNHDVAADQEYAYHLFFLGLVMGLGEMYDIESNIERGYGRADVIMKSKNPARPNLIIEFKQGEYLKRLKQEALDQIMKKKYYAKLAGPTLCIGLAHNKKNCEIVYQLL